MAIRTGTSGNCHCQRRLSCGPSMTSVGTSGDQMANSRRQFVTSGLGQTSSTLRTTPRWSRRRMAVIACIVLPNPISSARMAACRGYKNATPSNWNGNGCQRKSSKLSARSDSSDGCSKYSSRSDSLTTSRGGRMRVWPAGERGEGGGAEADGRGERGEWAASDPTFSAVPSPLSPPPSLFSSLPTSANWKLETRTAGVIMGIDTTRGGVKATGNVWRNSGDGSEERSETATRLAAGSPFASLASVASSATPIRNSMRIVFGGGGACQWIVIWSLGGAGRANGSSSRRLSGFVDRVADPPERLGQIKGIGQPRQALDGQLPILLQPLLNGDSVSP